MNQNSLHIEFEKLTDLIVGTLSDTQKAEVAAHLAVCPTCAILKNRAAKTISVMQSDRLEEVPSHILERTFDLLRERKSAPEKTPLFKRILAVLQTEDSAFTPAFGLRSSQTGTMRRLWLTAEDAEIDLRMQNQGETSDLAGQIFCDFVGGIAVLKSAEDEFETEMSDLCEFFFVAVPIGSYRLIFRFDEAEIEVPQIKVGD